MSFSFWDRVELDSKYSSKEALLKYMSFPFGFEKGNIPALVNLYKVLVAIPMYSAASFGLNTVLFTVSAFSIAASLKSMFNKSISFRFKISEWTKAFVAALSLQFG